MSAVERELIFPPHNPTNIRVLIVDDSALIRQMLTRALSMDPRIEIVGSAKDGVEAIQKARQLSPDIVTLDIQMPELDGLEALPHIRKHTRARVVMLSAIDDPETTYKALSLGAVDFLAKPSAMAGSVTEITDELLKKIKTAYRIKPERASAAAIPVDELVRPEPALAPPPRQPRIPLRVDEEPRALVCIASSTGGPPALERVFSGLSSNLGAVFAIVQHLPEGFAESLARRLSNVSDIRVSLAEDAAPMLPGRAYVAPYGRHLIVDRVGGRPVTRLIEGAPLHGVRPAADTLMKSAAEEWGDRSVAVVLTGMGADGAQGALAIKRAGGEVVIQDEETSIVWGMPGTAFKAGAATRAVPITSVAAEVRRILRTRTGAPR